MHPASSDTSQRPTPKLATRLCATLLIASSAATAAPPMFTSAVALQAPPDSAASFTNAFDSVAAGYGAAGSTVLASAVRWSAADGAASPLGGVPGQTTGERLAYGINDAGQVVGNAFLSGPAKYRAVRWEPDGTAVMLGDVPGQTSYSFAQAINNTGHAVGYAVLPGVGRAARWSPDGTGALLGDIPGHTTSGGTFALGINDPGHAVGYASIDGIGDRAVRWSPNGSAELLGEVPGQTVSYARSINDAGQAAGYLFLSNIGDRAVRWAPDGSASLLGSLPGLTYSYAHAITDSGLTAGVVGGPSGAQHAVLWDSAGAPTRLQDLMADGNDWNLTHAYGIDADAATLRILAYGSKNGGLTNYYLVTAPIPEPATAGLISLAMTSHLARRRRAKPKHAGGPRA